MLDGHGWQLKSLKSKMFRGLYRDTLSSSQYQTISIFPCHGHKALQLS